MFYVVNFLLKRIDICVTIRITKLRRTLLMLEIDSYHSELNGILSDLKITTDEILLFASCDLSADLMKSDTFLLLTKDLLVITGGPACPDGTEPAVRPKEQAAFLLHKEKRLYLSAFRNHRAFS